MDHLLTPDEAAKRLAVSESYLRKLRLGRAGPEFVKLGAAVRYEPQALRAWVEQARRQSTKTGEAEA